METPDALHMGFYEGYNHSEQSAILLDAAHRCNHNHPLPSRLRHSSQTHFRSAPQITAHCEPINARSTALATKSWDRVCGWRMVAVDGVGGREKVGLGSARVLLTHLEN